MLYCLNMKLLDTSQSISHFRTETNLLAIYIMLWHEK